jgi:hypothetical protein
MHAIVHPNASARRAAHAAVMAAAVAAALVASPGRQARAAAQPAGPAAQTLDDVAERAASGAWDSFSVDVTIHRRTVAADGRPVGPPQTTARYRWTRSRTATGWKSTTTLTSASAQTVQSRHGAVMLQPPATIVGVEDHGDGAPPRLFDSRGVEIALPPDGLRRRATPAGLSVLDDPRAAASGAVTGDPSSRSWIDEFVLPPAGRARRNEAIGRRLGRRAEVSNGVVRYVRHDHGAERETLVDERDGVVVATRLVDGGGLIEQATFTYDRAAGGALVKRGVQVERLAPAGHGSRAITEVVYTGIELRRQGEGGR